MATKKPHAGGRPRTKVREIPEFNGMEQMANATGIPLSILKHAKKNGCMFVNHGRCDLPMFLAWFFSDGKEKLDEAGVDWANRDKRAKALIGEVKLEEARGEVINAALTFSFLRNLVGNHWFGELDRIAYEFPALMKGKEEVPIHQECVRQIERIKLELKGYVDAFQKSVSKKDEEE